MVTGELQLRYEDVAMDGRVRLEPLTASLGLIWRKDLGHHPLYPWCRENGIIPITTRFVIEAFDGPFSVEDIPSVEGRWTVTQTREPTRFLLNMFTEVHAPIGRTNLPPPDDAGRRARMGRVVAEHVFTRPFAEAAERRVTELGEFTQTAEVVAWAEPKALLKLPEGATALGPAVADPAQAVLGLSHTDSNQHVNSLVYPRLFEEALLRRLHALGRPSDSLARFLDVRYRKPSFIGDALEIMLQPYEREGRVGACGAFNEPGGSARVYLRMEL